jgi:hypothetical protein
MVVANSLGEIYCLGPETHIKIKNNGGFLRFYENGIQCGAVDTNIYPLYNVQKPAKSALPESDPKGVSCFEPPTFGVTFLGS